MKTVTTEKYISLDDKIFETKKMCDLYERNYLTDKQLEDCFHFFHDKHEDIGDLDTASKPSDATHYKFEVERNEKEQTIKLYEYFRTYPSKKLCRTYTNLGLTIKHNQDFIVLYDAVRVYNEYHYQGKKYI
jgi:hypothetical protein